ncbi:MAG TPA: carbon-nitrogen hydrolase family protein [Polyangiaceae bacterium]|nr:carbon-nitrogen hydrolase family protein [Polyangiaceae bacterium]
MPTVRIAVASTPLTATLEEALPPVLLAIEQAGKLGARILCLPEAILPGHRMQKRPVEDATAAALDAALEQVAAAARAARVVTLVGTERPTPDRRQLVQVVFDENGSKLGEQVKTQVDPSEEQVYAPGSQRHLFTAAGVTFGMAICHEVFRYPEISRALALAGAQIIFAPHFVNTRDGSLPTRWLDATSPYNEKALLCRALENTVYVAAANTAGPVQGSASCIIAPDGALLASVPYGQVGIATADIDTERATRLIARRWAPERSTTLA